MLPQKCRTLLNSQFLEDSIFSSQIKGRNNLVPLPLKVRYLQGHSLAKVICMEGELKILACSTSEIIYQQKSKKQCWHYQPIYTRDNFFILLLDRTFNPLPQIPETFISHPLSICDFVISILLLSLKLNLLLSLFTQNACKVPDFNVKKK